MPLPAGHGTAAIEPVQLIDDGLRHLHSSLQHRFAYLIADGVHNDRRMVVIALHQGGDICLVILSEIAGVIVLALMVEPHVPEFIHDVHPQLVARFEDGFRGWIVGTPDGIEAILFQQGDAPVGCTFVLRRP